MRHFCIRVSEWLFTVNYHKPKKLNWLSSVISQQLTVKSHFSVLLFANDSWLYIASSSFHFIFKSFQISVYTTETHFLPINIDNVICIFLTDVGVAIGKRNRHILVQVHSATVMDSKFTLSIRVCWCSYWQDEQTYLSSGAQCYCHG